MVREKSPKKAPETKQPAETEAAAKPKRAAKPEPEPEPEPETPRKYAPGEVNTGLLSILPLPAFQRITALPVGGNVAAVDNSDLFLMFVRGAPLLFAASGYDKTSPLDLPAELRELAKKCEDGRGGNVFELGDLLKEMRRRHGGVN